MLPQNDSDGFTVFISYAHEDNESSDPSKQWLNRLLQHLQPLVFQKQVRAWSDTAIKPGERWQEAISQQLEKAKVAVLLVSPAFLASEFIRNSELPVLLKKAEERGLTVLPIILRRSLFTSTTFKYPDPLNGPEELSLKIFQAANSPDKPLNAMQEHEQDEVLVSIAQRIRELAEQEPSTGSPSEGVAATPPKGMPVAGSSVSHIPHTRNPFFTGRVQILDQLHRALIATGKAALSGLGGVGKTQTAIEYAYRHRSEYGVMLWAKADSEESLKTDYTALANKLELREKDETDKDVVIAAVKRWLEEHSGWLLILDNADDAGVVSDLLRREWGGHLLLTTRAFATGVIGKVEIEEMTPEEGTLFLLRRTKLIALDETIEAATEADKELAAEITGEVGGLPLALDQAGAFIEETPSSLTEYLELYRKEGARLRKERGGVIAAEHEPVTVTFSLAFGKVAEASAAAADMLRACAFLAPEAIPEEIFATGGAELGENISLIGGDRLSLVKMIREAARFSLIRRNTKNGTIEIHRVVQQVLKDEIDAKMRPIWAERVVRALNGTFPRVKLETWPLCDKLVPHAQEAAGLIKEYDLEFQESARLLNQAGFYCYERAQFTEAEPLYVLSLSIYEKALGSEHPDVAMSLNNLAVLYNEQGKYSEAEERHIQSLSIREKVHGPEHQEVAQSLNNLALLYSDQGKYTEAEELYQRSLVIFEKVLGQEHPEVGRTLNNLALLYYEQGKLPQAESLYMRALSIREKGLGPEHPEVGQALNNLALLYAEQGRYAEAKPLYMRALSIFEKVLGPDDPRSQVVRNNYTALLEKMRNEAEE